MKRPKRNWSGKDKHLGPFTYSRDQISRTLGIIISSGHAENPGCHVRLQGFGHTLISELPPILVPRRHKVKAGWDEETILRLGRDWYWDEHARVFGFQVFDGFLLVKYGQQTHDSSTDKSRGYFLPWTQWRFVRQSWYGPTGQHIETLWETSGRAARHAQHEWKKEFEKNLAMVVFEFQDYDGEVTQASTNIEEREWRFGTGLFKWLSVFRQPKISRSLKIQFSKETGRKKKSWKGGTVGHAIEMLPGELHEGAFRRYCEAHEMAFRERKQ